MNNPLPKMWFKISGVKYGKKLTLVGIPFLYRFSNSSIEIGENCRINSSFFSNLIGLYQRSIIISRNESSITIGNNVGLSGVTIYSRASIKIGNNVLIGGNTKILDNDFHPIDPNDRLNDPNNNINAKSIIIEDNVFIGCNCLILKGVTIGKNSVIGAGSVVTKDVPENCIVAGNPAKVVKVLL